MIIQTERIYKRSTYVGLGTETVKVRTYWLLGLFPVYSFETIIATTEMKNIE